MTPTPEVFIQATGTDPAVQSWAVIGTGGRRLLAALRPKIAMLTELELGADAREAARVILTDFCTGPVRHHLNVIDQALCAPAAGSPETRLLIRALRTAAAALAQDIDALTRTDDAHRTKTIAQSIEARLATHLAVVQAVLLPALAALPGGTPPTTPNGEGTRRVEGTPGAPAPHVLCDTQALTATPAAPAGELWRLSTRARELDAGITQLLPGQRRDTRAPEDPDVLLLILAGDATVATAQGPRHLTKGTLLWLPRGSTAALTAGENGLSCLTVHRRRPGTPTRRTKQSTPRQPSGSSPAPPGGTAQPDWPRWLC